MDALYHLGLGQKNILKNFKSKNAIEFRDNCFHLYLNENYKSKEAHEIVKVILKIEKYYAKA